MHTRIESLHMKSGAFQSSSIFLLSAFLSSSYSKFAHDFFYSLQLYRVDMAIGERNTFLSDSSVTHRCVILKIEQAQTPVPLHCTNKQTDTKYLSKRKLGWCWGRGKEQNMDIEPNYKLAATRHIIMCQVQKIGLRMTKLIYVLRKEGSKMKKRMKEEEIEKGDCGPPTWKVFFFEILSDLFEDGAVVYPANAFNSRLQGD